MLQVPLHPLQILVSPLPIVVVVVVVVIEINAAESTAMQVSVRGPFLAFCFLIKILKQTCSRDVDVENHTYKSSTCDMEQEENFKVSLGYIAVQGQSGLCSRF